MKKMLKITILFLFVLFLGGCKQEEETKDEKDLKMIESFGLSKEEAENYFGYVNSICIAIDTLCKIDDDFINVDYQIPDNDYKMVVNSFDLASKYASKLPKENSSYEFEYILTEATVTPKKLMDNMQLYKRNAGYAEINILLGSIDSYTDGMVTSFDVSNKDKKSLFKYYTESLKLQGTFEEVQELILQDNDFDNL